MMHCVKIWIERHAHDFGCMLCSYLRSEKKHRYCPAYVTLWTWIRKQHPDNLKKNNNLTIMEVPHHAYLDWNRKNEIQINIGKDIYIYIPLFKGKQVCRTASPTYIENEKDKRNRMPATL
jgi:hypothetical protein